MYLKKLQSWLNNWEQWPFNLIYAPLGFVWLYYAVKARHFWFFSAVNPTLEFSGFEGETKKEMYAQLPQELYPKTIFIQPGCDFNQVESLLNQHSFSYPFIVKPDIGMHAMMFKKIMKRRQLENYHRIMPYEYIIQEWVDMPLEFSVFHIRYPESEKGMITGFIMKEYLQVTGDGKSTLLELIKQNPRAALRLEEMQKRHAGNLDKIISSGEKYYLSIAGNHNRGARFINLQHEIDERLNNVFDNISHKAKHFYYGRYDFKCTSVEDLKNGKNIQILEYNGAGAEPNHIYDCGMKYTDALKTIAFHWKHMYRISVINQSTGARMWSYWQGRNYLKKGRRILHHIKELDFESID